MDEDLTCLEAELRALAPSPPPVTLERRIAAELAAGSVSLPWWRLALLPLATAAGFAGVLWLARQPSFTRADPPEETSAVASVPEPAPDRFRPVRMENVLYERTEEEVVTATGAPARRERLRYVDTITWQHPRTNASLTWSVPREEVRVVPIQLH